MSFLMQLTVPYLKKQYSMYTKLHKAKVWNKKTDCVHVLMENSNSHSPLGKVHFFKGIMKASHRISFIPQILLRSPCWLTLSDTHVTMWSDRGHDTQSWLDFYQVAVLIRCLWSNLMMPFSWSPFLMIFWPLVLLSMG